MAEIKKETSSVLLTIFVLLVLALGAAFYMFENYYYAEMRAKFEDPNPKTGATADRIKNLDEIDFSFFEGDKFNSLEKGYWFDNVEGEINLEPGTNNPFLKETYDE